MISSVFVVLLVTKFSYRGEIDSAWIYKDDAINYLQYDLKCHESEDHEDIWINDYQHYRIVEVSIYRWDK